MKKVIKSLVTTLMLLMGLSFSFQASADRLLVGHTPDGEPVYIVGDSKLPKIRSFNTSNMGSVVKGSDSYSLPKEVYNYINEKSEKKGVRLDAAFNYCKKILSVLPNYKKIMIGEIVDYEEAKKQIAAGLFNDLDEDGFNNRTEYCDSVLRRTISLL